MCIVKLSTLIEETIALEKNEHGGSGHEKKSQERKTRILVRALERRKREAERGTFCAQPDSMLHLFYDAAQLTYSLERQEPRNREKNVLFSIEIYFFHKNIDFSGKKVLLLIRLKFFSKKKI